MRTYAHAQTHVHTRKHTRTRARHMFAHSQAVALLPDMKPVDCANIMVAFARFGHYHPEVIRMIPQV